MPNAETLEGEFEAVDEQKEQAVAKLDQKEPSQSLSIQAEKNPVFALVEKAVENNFEIEKLEKLLNMQADWEDRQARKTYFAALSKFQSILPTIKKDKRAQFPNSKGGCTEYEYASLDTITEQIRPHLEATGLSYRFVQEQAQGGIIKVTCVVTHIDGHEQRCALESLPDNSGKKNAIQSIASTISYLKKYTLCGAFGIATEAQDDDGHASAGQLPEPQPQVVYYPEENFNAHFPKWKEAVLAGKKTISDIEKMASSRATLTKTQLKKIKGIN